MDDDESPLPLGVYVADLAVVDDAGAPSAPAQIQITIVEPEPEPDTGMVDTGMADTDMPSKDTGMPSDDTGEVVEMDVPEDTNGGGTDARLDAGPIDSDAQTVVVTTPQRDGCACAQPGGPTRGLPVWGVLVGLTLCVVGVLRRR